MIASTSVLYPPAMPAMLTPSICLNPKKMKLSEISSKQIAPYKKWLRNSEQVQNVLVLVFSLKGSFFFAFQRRKPVAWVRCFVFGVHTYFSGGSLSCLLPHVLFCFIVFVLLTRFSFFFPFLFLFKPCRVFKRGELVGPTKEKIIHLTFPFLHRFYLGCFG